MGAKTRTASYDKLVPDTRYGSLLLSKFINCLMSDGKKSVATRVVYDALDQVKKRMPDADPIQVFTDALEQRKADSGGAGRGGVGGANYQVLMQVKPKRAESLAIRWVLAAIRGEEGPPRHMKLAEEAHGGSTSGRARRWPSANKRSRWPKRTRRSATSRGDRLRGARFCNQRQLSVGRVNLWAGS